MVGSNNVCVNNKKNVRKGVCMWKGERHIRLTKRQCLCIMYACKCGGVGEFIHVYLKRLHMQKNNAILFIYYLMLVWGLIKVIYCFKSTFSSHLAAMYKPVEANVKAQPNTDNTKP